MKKILTKVFTKNKKEGLILKKKGNDAVIVAVILAIIGVVLAIAYRDQIIPIVNTVLSGLGTKLKDLMNAI